ncbi:MAG: 1-deoxy-D-xylulose-5-phosphate synthase N-terminal domain-containing protein [Patescibacteria group bacterium]
MPYNILNAEEFSKLKNMEPNRFKHDCKDSVYLDLRGLALEPSAGFEVGRLQHLAKILRGLIFATVEGAQSGHPGGSSSKVEQFLAMVFGGAMSFDPTDPKNPGRDRVIWSAGHCTPLLYSGLALIYETLRRSGRQFSEAVLHPIFPEDLIRFRHVDGPSGHAESFHPLSDYSTGPSGHGLAAAGGIAITHRSCGLDTKVWVFMGDAESEEGMSYEARNVLAATGTKNIIVSLDFNHYGIDGNINEVISSDYLNHWLGMGWNVIEADGHNLTELNYAYKLAAQGFDNSAPAVIIAHTTKGKCYGSKENSQTSHGSQVAHDEYIKIENELGFAVPGNKGNVMEDIATIFENLKEEDELYLDSRFKVTAENIKSEAKLVEQMKKSLSGRPIVKPQTIKRPDKLPPELVFEQDTKVSTRKAAQAWMKWLMTQTAFFYAGAGDLSGSVLTNSAEQVYGIINKQNPLGRGVRFGIAEQNMAMMSAAMTQDVLPGNFQPISVFSTYAVFTGMIANCVRLALFNNSILSQKGFFILLASHDGPETGEDGPTHHGQFWMSLYDAFPGIKVYKPLDANETIEMLFYALEKGEPIVLSVGRPDVPVIKRIHTSPQDATLGAYVFKNYSNNNQEKIVLAISGSLILKNVLEILPELEKSLDVKIVAVTSPKLAGDRIGQILSTEEKDRVITLHNGWSGFLNSFILPEDYKARSIGVDNFLKSGKPDELYELAGLTPEKLKEKILESRSPKSDRLNPTHHLSQIA